MGECRVLFRALGVLQECRKAPYKNQSIYVTPCIPCVILAAKWGVTLYHGHNGYNVIPDHGKYAEFVNKEKEFCTGNWFAGSDSIWVKS